MVAQSILKIDRLPVQVRLSYYTGVGDVAAARPLKKTMSGTIIVEISEWRAKEAEIARLSVRNTRWAEARCLITGHPCGTDTRPEGQSCTCGSCVMRDEIARLTAENASLRRTVDYEQGISVGLQKRIDDLRERVRVAERKGRLKKK